MDTNTNILVKVHQQASNIIEKVKNKKGTIQSLCLAKYIIKKKLTVALTSEVLKCTTLILKKIMI
jgi:hypothetical protein